MNKDVDLNKVLRNMVKKVLLIPIVKRNLEKVCDFYLMTRPEQLRLREAFIERYARALESGQPDFDEAFLGGDAKALEKLVNMVIRDKVTVLEVGSWKGMSTSVLAKAVADYNGKVFAVDHWMGNEGDWNYDIARDYDIYSIFKRNMILSGIWGMVHPLVMDSQTASQIFADGILDLVFIDGDHRYDSVMKDISSWLPKLRKGGILCGHDCEGYYSEYPEEVKKMIDGHLGDYYTAALRCHCGVVKALHDHFRDKYSIMPGSTVWYYMKTEE
jgi:predicted O-methyltransferase YrrM